MKTKNAFAFRDFDSARILQRPFFKNFYFEPNKSDTEILDSLSESTEDSIDSLEKKSYIIQATHERLTKLCEFLSTRCFSYTFLIYQRLLEITIGICKGGFYYALLHE